MRPDRSRPSILVVDDDPLQREILVALVGEFGCDGVGASDGARALAAVARSKFHVILMDCHMPTIDGCEVARRIREHEVDLVINIPSNDRVDELTNGYVIRRAAVDFNVPLITNRQIAQRFIEAVTRTDAASMAMKAWDEY